MVKEGKEGWVEMGLGEVDVEVGVKYGECRKLRGVRYVWREGVDGGKLGVKLGEGKGII